MKAALRSRQGLRAARASRANRLNNLLWTQRGSPLKLRWISAQPEGSTRVTIGGSPTSAGPASATVM